MKLFDFYIDKDLVLQNQVELADTIRVLLYKENPALFNRLTYESDLTFLEPTLFYFFLAKSKNLTKATIEQSVFGYMDEDKRPTELEALADQYGMINLPKVGYVLTEPSKLHRLRLDPDRKEKIVVEGYPSKFVPDTLHSGTNIRLCKHHTFLISQLSLDGQIVQFNESAQDTLTKHFNHIEKAFSLINSISSDFYDLMKSTVRELVVMNSPNIYSMSAISHHGTAFLNTNNLSHDEVFFVDDIAHQCGHVIYNALTLQTTEYLKVHKKTLLRDFISEKREGRTVYSAFHGLFTYSSILYFLDKCFCDFTFNEKQKHEILGRLVFYTVKFGNDLVSLTNDEIFTPTGMLFIDSFRRGYDFILDKYRTPIKETNLDGSPYVFGYEFYSLKNSITKFRQYLK